VSTYASKNTGLPPTLQLKIKTRCWQLLKKYCLTLFWRFRIWKRKAGYWLGWAAKRKSTICNRAYFESILYGDHVYGNIVTGNQSTVSKLTVNDLGSFTKWITIQTMLPSA
jgi:hypothetical protein